MTTYIVALAMYIILMSLVYNIGRYIDAVYDTRITETIQRQIDTVRRIVLDTWKRTVTFVTKF